MAELELTEGKLRRLRNLKLYRGLSNEEILEMRRKSQSSPKKLAFKADRGYEKRFGEKFELLQKEFALDMNNSNDVEMLSQLVRQMLQAENVDKDIRSIQERDFKSKDDIATLKALGDFQRDVQLSVSDLQDKLGISRKQRKEKATDDIPQWIDSVLLKARDFWNRKTETVDCPNCQIELARYWINFPDLASLISFTLECSQCNENIVYNG